MAEEQKNILTIDGKEYDADNLTDAQKKIILNIQFADQELNRLRMLTAAIQTARQGYVNALKTNLENTAGEDGDNASE